MSTPDCKLLRPVVVSRMFWEHMYAQSGKTKKYQRVIALFQSNGQEQSEKQMKAFVSWW